MPQTGETENVHHDSRRHRRWREQIDQKRQQQNGGDANGAKEDTSHFSIARRFRK
jgi:hypothetical protein